jgi:hypothetical protein
MTAMTANQRDFTPTGGCLVAAVAGRSAAVNGSSDGGVR